MDAAMTVDALQYAPSKQAAFEEFTRILRPNGRLVFAAFELDPVRTVGLPLIGEDPVEDYRPLLESQDFDVLTYDPRWRDRLTNGISRGHRGPREASGRNGASGYRCASERDDVDPRA